LALPPTFKVLYERCSGRRLSVPEAPIGTISGGWSALLTGSRIGGWNGPAITRLVEANGCLRGGIQREIQVFWTFVKPKSRRDAARWGLNTPRPCFTLL